MEPSAPSTPASTPEGGAPLVPSEVTTPPSSATVPLGSVIMDESLRTHTGLAKFQDVDSLAKSYVELDKMRNERSGVKPLTETSTPEEIAAYRVAMGVPEKPDAYDFGEMSFPEEATPDQAILSQFKEVFHQAHLTNAQVQAVMHAYSQYVSQQWNGIRDAQESQNRTTLEGLTRKYGAQAPQLITMAQEYVRRRFGQEGLDALNFTPGGTAGAGSSPQMIELLIESAKLTGHDKFIIADSRGGMMTKETALGKIAELNTLLRERKISEADYREQYNHYGPIAYGDA